MTGRTSIEWTAQPGYVGAVWNPTTGCTRVSDGCDNCYAFALHDRRYASNLKTVRAASTERWLKPTEQVADARSAGLPLPFSRQYDVPFSRVQLIPGRLDVPLRTRKPTCYFVDSMADLFHEDVPGEFIDRVWQTMWRADWHRFLILTKRPERMLDWASHVVAWDGGQWPLPNVWLGTSVEDQRAADERIPHLLATPAAVRFLSCEPLLGPVDLAPHLAKAHADYEVLRSHRNDDGMQVIEDVRALGPLVRELNWVIAGGESGPRARPMDLAWARSLRDQCAAAGVPFFMKQLGSGPPSASPTP